MKTSARAQPSINRGTIATDSASPQKTGCTGLKTSDRAAREEILHRAYAIWLEEGQPADRQLANWLEAEKDVLQHS